MNRKEKKKDIIVNMLAESDIFICVDATADNVILPQAHKLTTDLRLILSLNFRHTPEFHDEHIAVTLLFGGVPFDCILPYASIWGIYKDDFTKSYFWEEEMPDEPLSELNEIAALRDLESGKPRVIKRKKKKEETSEETEEEIHKEEITVYDKQNHHPLTFTLIDNPKKEKKKEPPSKEKKKDRSHLKLLK